MKNHCFHSRFLPLLALLLALLCLPLRSTLAATTATKEAYAVLSTDKKTLTFYYDTYKSSRVGTIYDSSKFTKTYNTRGWSTDDTTITTVTFNSSFSSYTSLTSTAYWFYGMENLTTINGLSYLKTNNVTTMSSMFSGCKSLTSLNLSNFSTANVTAMGSMFSGCKGLTSLNVSSFNMAKVTNMGGLFSNCESLTSLDLSTFNTANVTNMGSMFSGCKGLTNLDVSNFNTASVTDMGGMFYNCSNLPSLDLSGFNTGMVQSMTHSISLNPNYNTYTPTINVGMFVNCTNLETIRVGSQWTTDAVNSSSEMFYNCTSLVGGDGTVYGPNYTDKTKAYAGRGGYLTLKVDDDLQYYLNSLTDSEDSFEDGVYTRQFTNWDWQTLYVPFSMSYSNWQARFEVASVTGVQQGENGPELVATILEEGTTEPNTPYLIRAKVKARSRLKVSAGDMVDEQENSTSYGSYSIHGNYGSLSNLKETRKYRLRCNALYIPENNDEVLPPCRWYLTLPSNMSSSQVRIRINGIEESTAIAEQRTDEPETATATDGTAYDLLGRKVRTDADGKAPLRKGLYIINNKKRVVK